MNQRSTWALIAVVAAPALWLVLLGLLVLRGGNELWVVLVIAPLLVALTYPIVAAAARRLELPWLVPIAVSALALKLAGSLARYWTAFVFYDGQADAAGYHDAGVAFVHVVHLGGLPALPADIVGTEFIGVITGVVYTLTWPSIFAGYLVFSWIGFWGLFFAVLAHATAFPLGPSKRYAALVLFLPSLLFWPSGLGKEAWMMFGVGLTMFGAALLVDGRLRGAFPFALGLLAAAMVRPHVTALLVGSLLVALILRPSRRRTPLTPVVKATIVVAATVLLVVAVRWAAEYVGIEDLSPEAVQAELQTRYSNTSQGGSEFEGAFTTSPTGIPWALVTVLFRPFPYEAGGLLPLLSSLEGLLLIFLLWRYGKPLLRLPRYLRQHPYVTFCVSYVLFYAVVFSGFSNFGILVRQRSLVLPAFLVLLALPELTRRVRSSGLGEAGSSRPTIRELTV
jgi:hypothetical protein